MARTVVARMTRHLVSHEQTGIGKLRQRRVKIIRQLDTRHGAESGPHRRMHLLLIGGLGFQEVQVMPHLP